MLVQDPYTGEWVEEETEENARIEDMIKAEGTRIDPGYRYDFSSEGELEGKVNIPPRPQLLGDDTYDDTPISSGEAIGYGDRMIVRKPGEEEFTTLGGNIPMEDYFKSGGYRSKPDDPHGDSDVIYYPNEMHTKNKEGGWDVAQRNAPPKPPTEDELDTFQEVSAFREFHLKEVDAKAKAASEEVLAGRKKNRSITTDALMKPYQLEQRDAADERAAKSAYDSIFNPGRAEVNNYLNKKSAQLLEEKKNLREKAEEEAKYARNLADRERISAERATEKATIDAEKRADRMAKAASVKGTDRKRLSDMDFAARQGGYHPNDVALVKDEAERLGYQYLQFETSGGKGVEWKLIKRGVNQGEPAQKSQASSKPDETSLYNDLIKNGRSEQSAREYIAKARQRGLLK